MKYSRVLTIAGSDSGGGAGVQADIKAISACGAYTATAITAVTVQNTLGVEAVHPVPLEIIEGQIEAVLSDIGADAVKIGMLHSAEVVELVCRMIDKYQPRAVVLDPVMVSTSGHRLIEETAVEALRKKLIPRSTIITPNLPEAEILIGRKITGQADFEAATRELAAGGDYSVLLKAGHLDGELLTDIFYDAQTAQIHSLTGVRIETPNKHGTGCTLSSTIAAYLALGMTLWDAVRSAKEYLEGAILSGAKYEIGSGHGPVDHFYRQRR
ncbi:MAG: bifunctional hydroxymethylpyrimidine kinase/phosphomethylpyrimidine kinase [Rikenellaceae bacterium]